jgi:MFS family permease
MWMQRIAIGWLTWQLTGSGLWLGIVAFADFFPVVLIGPIAGAAADRGDRLRVVKTSQTISLVQATVLFLLTASGHMTIGLLVALTAFQGMVVAFNQPARLALVPSLIPPSDLATAVAINSVVFNLARFIGPACGGEGRRYSGPNDGRASAGAEHLGGNSGQQFAQRASADADCNQEHEQRGNSGV